MKVSFLGVCTFRENCSQYLSVGDEDLLEIVTG